ncbi:MAG: Eco57I restriction-modification methylase domain-containing protein [Prevotella sp.]|jgi:hypothetical protein|nr:Eco57I restriction-modification methylase domain-containing protein [Prevotella sp.]MCI2124426.1 Eco57I restriction-modification methylase domain-containing protein [Prevotella sp.]
MIRLKKAEFVSYVKNNEFYPLFNEIGWNNHRGDSHLADITVNDVTYTFTAIAERDGFQILTCQVEQIPIASVYKKIDTKLRRYAHDYICIYFIPNTCHHLWVVPVNKVEKRDLVGVEYSNTKQSEFLYEKIDGFSFETDEHTTIVDVREKVQGVFAVNSEKITKKFYDEFKKQHTTFARFIEGIDDEIDIKDNKNKQWYTSIMLNRLMFCYFIQKKGFLNGDVDYLQHKLHEVQEQEGQDEFFAFYLDFLIQLFHDGLNAPVHDAAFQQKFGCIPYLNGGLFDYHQLERQYQNIRIKDEAFQSLFDFFDKWEWHLDTRVSASGNDINPDVLGYIFEQYINDRAQMGAYYTKEDITEYIGRNTIIPFLLNKVKETSSEKSFAPDGEVWQMLKKSGTTYIYDAAKYGYSTDWKERLPKEIAIGLDTTQPDLLQRRSHWNEKTGEEFALPTEIWRETIDRLKRCGEIKNKIETGAIHEVNDFITYNLNLRSFTYDLLANTKDHLLVEHFYHALQKITILDPTCGSGAFLFAAMNILEPLYEICIDRMESFHEQNKNLFKDELGEISNKYRSNIQYFIYKSIILRNLYGVDIMVEATEIAKLRLFLKMVAVVEVDKRAENMGLDPLPDIDFNIRCGNTLVGYATEQQLNNAINYGDAFAQAELKKKVADAMDKVAFTYKTFKWLQINQSDNMPAYKEAKKELKERLASLNEVLNKHLYRSTSNQPYEEWLKNTQPFHWIAEFYDIIKGEQGFDVIIGNPPYLEIRQINYCVTGYKTTTSGAVHSFCMERGTTLLNKKGTMSMIVPIALICTQRMQAIQKILELNRNVWYSNFAWRPAKLFDAVNRALSIFIINPADHPHCFTTPYRKWSSENRSLLFQSTAYICYDFKRTSFWMPKLQSMIELSILEKILHNNTIANYIDNNSQNKIYYRTTGGLYWKVFTDFPPKFIYNGIEGHSSRETKIRVNEKIFLKSITAFLSSNTFWWWYTITSNLRDLNPSDIFGIKIPENTFNDKELITLGENYINNLCKNSSLLTREQKGKGTTRTQLFKISKSKPIIDEIDKVLAKHYGFTDEELDFIINYDIKYRMGDELNDND